MSHLHPNGHGIVSGQADVSFNAFLDSDSLASEHCSFDSGHVSRSLLAGDVRVSNSTIISSLIECDRVVDSFVFQSKLQGKTVVRSSHLDRVSLTGTIITEGKLSDFELECHHPSDYLRISGIWTRAPRFFNAGQYFCSEGQIIDGVQFVNIGCKSRPAEYWLTHYNLASRLGVDEDMIREFILSLSSELKCSPTTQKLHQ